MPYSEDFRRRAVALHQSGEWTTRELEELLGADHTSVARWARLMAFTGDVKDAPSKRGRARKLGEEGLGVVRELIEAKRDSSLRELIEALRERTGAMVSAPTMSRALSRLGLTIKKRVSTPASGIGRK